jgi:hypothetical protein
MPRAFGTEISGNSRRGPDLSEYARGKLVGLREAGLSFREIDEDTGVPKTTIQSTYELDAQRDEGRSQPRKGHPKSYDKRLERHLLRYVRNNPKATYRDLTRHVWGEFSRTTFYRILKTYNITN